MTATVIREEAAQRIPALMHRDWLARMPWLVQGTSTRGPEDTPFDLGHFTGASPVDRVRGHWIRLLSETGMDRAVLGRQVHGTDVVLQRGLAPGVRLSDVCDGHVTDEPGTLLTVTIADCVPVFLVAPSARSVAVVHAGWRGAVAGVLERGLAALMEVGGVEAAGVLVHLGPSICGSCYEVGPEVFEALGEPVPDAPEPIDLRRLLARRTNAAGVPWGNVSMSAHCTRCTESQLFSHRGGDGERQVGFIGIRSRPETDEA
jgi:YfiH family protein